MNLARRIQNEYSPTVEFYAVSCDAHPKLCNELGIDSTPSMYVYKKQQQQGQGRKIERDDNDESDKHWTPELFARELELTPSSSSSSSSSVVMSSRRMDDTPGIGQQEEDEEDDHEDGDGDGDGKDEAAEDDDKTKGDEQGEDDGSGDSPDTDTDTDGGGDAPAPGGGGGGHDEGELVDNSPDDDDKDNEGGQDQDEDQDEDDDGKNDTPEEEDEDEDAGGNEDDNDNDDKADSGPLQGRAGLPGPGWKAGPAGLPQLGGAAVQRPHDAGHNKARNKEKDIDRYKQEMRARREEYQRKREGLGKFVRPDNRKDKHGQFKKRHDSAAMTPGMKAFTPGTMEHQQREDVMKKRMRKAHKKMRIPAQVTAKTPLTKEALPYTKDVRKRGIVKKAASHIPLVGRRFRMTPEEELILDVSLSFVVGLETGVKYPNGAPLDEKQRTALGNYLDLLNVSLPPEWGIHKLIDNLRRRLWYVSQSADNLTRVLSEHPLPRRTWSRSCVSRTKGTMGFSCGFWKLLHVTTVGVAEQRGGLSLVETGMVGPQTKLFSPIDAADTIRDYMENFFNCGTCRKYFVENYNNCENNRRCDRLTQEIEEASIADWKELSVWLWETHNEVSVRLLKEAKQRAKRLGTDGTTVDRILLSEEIAVVWPNIETCFLCFNDDGTWDEAEVFKYLESTYWPDSDLDPKSERLIHYEDDDGSFVFGMILWIAMFCVLWLVYSTIGTTSPASFQQGVYQAKRMVTKGPGAKKERSN